MPSACPFCSLMLVITEQFFRITMGCSMEMPMDPRPCRFSDKLWVESLGAYTDGIYMNGLLGVTTSLGD
jgi:hypothetical protein